MRAGAALARITGAIPPASGGFVMATGIVSLGLRLDQHETLSRILLALAGLGWVALGLLLASRAIGDRDRLARESHSPAALTGVAATAVLGTRLLLLGWGGLGAAMLVIALVFWAALLWPVLAHWTTPTLGVSLMLTVSTESLAVLCATLGNEQHQSWLVSAALAPFALGLAFYVFVIARFDLHQLAVGHGDHWITGGALAISTLSAGRITLAARQLHALTGASGTLETVSVVLWALTMAWLPALLVFEVVRPRLGYDVRRWATVFPVGMYAACSFIVGAAASAAGIRDFGRVWVWVGVAVWLAVFAGMVRRGWRLAAETDAAAMSEA